MVAQLSISSPNQEYKENLQELFEKIDQEDDGEVYLRFDKFFKVPDPNYTPITILFQFHFHYNAHLREKSLFREVVLFLRAVNEDVDKNEKVHNKIWFAVYNF